MLYLAASLVGLIIGMPLGIVLFVYIFREEIKDGGITITEKTAYDALNRQESRPF